MAKDYTWRCDCDKEGEAKTLAEARRQAGNHLKHHFDKVPRWHVLIDEYDSEAGDFGNGELTGRYWQLTK